MKAISTLLTILMLLGSYHLQAGIPGLLENYQNRSETVLPEQLSIEAEPNVQANLKTRPAEPFTYGLEKGMNLFGFSINLSSSSGKTRPDGEKINGSIGLHTDLIYHRMLSETFAIGGFISQNSNFSRYPETDEKRIFNALYTGLTTTFYWGFGELNRGGIKSELIAGAGFTRANDKIGNEITKGPVSPSFAMQLDVGGWVMATKCLMVFSDISLVSYNVTMRNYTEAEGYDNSTNHSFTFGLSTMYPTLGIKILTGKK